MEMWLDPCKKSLIKEPSGTNTLEFVKSIYIVHKQLKDYITVHRPYYVYLKSHPDDENCGRDLNWCRAAMSHCFYDGKYCLYPRSIYVDKKNKKALAEQTIRSAVVFDLEPEKWWDFAKMTYQCFNLNALQSCNDKAYEAF